MDPSSHDGMAAAVRGSMNVVDLGDWYDCCDVAMLRCVWATVVTVALPVGWSVGQCSACAPSKMV